ncbi:MAG: hypothetical protein Q9225_001715, partial [Loekoesia sp. 1 TL-2023]
MANDIIIPVTGSLYWVEIWFRDNSSNPDGVQVVESEKKVVRSVKISQFNESTKEAIENTKQSASAKAEVGASYGVVSATVSTEISASKEITDTYSYTAREQRDMSVEETTIDRTKYEIKGHGRLGLYQAYFSAPGIDVSLSQSRTGGSKPPSEDVKLEVRMHKLDFISSLEAVYTDNGNDRPFDCLHEITRQNEDINSGFGGKYVYLKPVYTNQVSQALTDCRVRIESNPWSGGTDDLAKGAGGAYRYLQFNKDARNHQKFETSALLRRAGGPATIKDAPDFNVLTTDINKDRGGDY